MGFKAMIIVLFLKVLWWSKIKILINISFLWWFLLHKRKVESLEADLSAKLLNRFNFS